MRQCRLHTAPELILINKGRRLKIALISNIEDSRLGETKNWQIVDIRHMNEVATFSCE